MASPSGRSPARSRRGFALVERRERLAPTPPGTAIGREIAAERGVRRAGLAQRANGGEPVANAGGEKADFGLRLGAGGVQRGAGAQRRRSGAGIGPSKARSTDSRLIWSYPDITGS